VRSDGATLRVNSGDSDRWYPEVVAFIRTHLPERYRRALAVATHCEAKVAIAMRDGWTGSENVVVDKTVCGTRTFDSHQKWTCDKLLPMLLPPGARLTVVQGDGTSRTYVGAKDPA
jgi:SCP1.201-like deaminase